MQSVSTISKWALIMLVFFIARPVGTQAQENSPFSRYGLGDLYPGQNIVNRAMGGLSSTYAGSRYNLQQNVNFANPASYGGIFIVNYDLGLTLDSRTLRSANPVAKYNSVYLIPSYVALGMPINVKKKIGLAFGLKPVTKVSYNIYETYRKGLDSLLYLYEGSGGLYQGFIGLGKQWKNLSLGFNTGYYFGNKSVSTKTVLIDSLTTYKSNSSAQLSYNHAFINVGMQYQDTIGKSKKTLVRLGFSGNLKERLNATRQLDRQTYTYDANDNPVTIDSVYKSPEETGTITLPSSYTVGISFIGLKDTVERSMIGIEYERSNWSQFRNFGEADKMIDSWKLKLGGQFTPNPFDYKSYWNTVSYRAGFAFGKEPVNADGNTMPFYTITLGAALPVRKFYRGDYQSSIINTALEFGKRGAGSNNITENYFRFCISVNLMDRWFIKRRYD